MSEYFNEAFLGSQSPFSNAGLGDDEDIFDFEAASTSHLRDNPGTRRTSVEDVEFSDASSDNNDGLFYDSTPSFVGSPEQEEAGEEEDDAGEQVQSWKIDHSSGDHKLRGKLEWPSKYILIPTVLSHRLYQESRIRRFRRCSSVRDASSTTHN
jgi:hypothetical protein